MSTKDLVDGIFSIIKAAVTSWPLAVVFLALIFKKNINELIDNLKIILSWGDRKAEIINLLYINQFEILLIGFTEWHTSIEEAEKNLQVEKNQLNLDRIALNERVQVNQTKEQELQLRDERLNTKEKRLTDLQIELQHAVSSYKNPLTGSLSSISPELMTDNAANFMHPSPQLTNSAMFTDIIAQPPFIKAMPNSPLTTTTVNNSSSLATTHVSINGVSPSGVNLGSVPLNLGTVK